MVYPLYGFSRSRECLAAVADSRHFLSRADISKYIGSITAARKKRRAQLIRKAIEIFFIENF